jgi:carbonic anhydrase
MPRPYSTSPFASTRQRRALAPLDPDHTLLVSCFDAVLPLEQMGLSVRGVPCAEVRSPAHLVAPWNGDAVDESTSLMVSLSMRETHDIVICGHMACRSLEVFLDEDRSWHLFQLLSQMPAARATIDLVRRHYRELEGEALREVLAQENVLTQVDHMLTYPLVSRDGGPRVHGWIYDERDISVWAYSFEESEFVRYAPPGFGDEA